MFDIGPVLADTVWRVAELVVICIIVVVVLVIGVPFARSWYD